LTICSQDCQCIVFTGAFTTFGDDNFVWVQGAVSCGCTRNSTNKKLRTLEAKVESPNGKGVSTIGPAMTHVKLAAPSATFHGFDDRIRFAWSKHIDRREQRFKLERCNHTPVSCDVKNNSERTSRWSQHCQIECCVRALWSQQNLSRPIRIVFLVVASRTIIGRTYIAKSKLPNVFGK